MNLSKHPIASIDRIIAHEIHPKTENKDAYAVTHDTLLGFSNAEKDILITRLKEAINNTTKTFQLDFEDKSECSVHATLKRYSALDEKGFIDYSKMLAEKLAQAHFRTRIPGGLCLFGDGKTVSNKSFVFIIKAELQEVFNIERNKLRVIENVFLSPAKDFYKLGFFIENGNAFTPYMYDDQFSLQKKDLTEYFYGQFLGLTTDKNDSLRTKNFYDDTKAFIETNVDNIKDRTGLLKALTVLYREEATGVISPKDFGDKYFESELRAQFEKKIISAKYSNAFTKDISLIENRLDLQRITIPLTHSVFLVGNTSALHQLDVVSEPDSQFYKTLEPEINSGRISKLVILRQKESDVRSA